jgi:hypothetical protein
VSPSTINLNHHKNRMATVPDAWLIATVVDERLISAVVDEWLTSAVVDEWLISTVRQPWLLQQPLRLQCATNHFNRA